MKKISIIVPIYNCSNFLERCLDSIINQTYTNIEIICINDGSTDNSLEILNHYTNIDNRIILINKKNEGVSVARNVGISRSTGEYITFVDADDWLETNAIEVLYDISVENDVDVVRGNYYINSNNEKYDSIGNTYELNKKVLKKDDYEFKINLVDKLLYGEIPCFVWLLLIKKEIIQKPISFPVGIPVMEDTIFYLELLNNIESIYLSNIPIYHYFYNKQSATRAPEYYIRNIYNLLEVNKKVINLINQSKFKDEIRIKKVNAFHASQILNCLYLLYRNSGHKKTKEFMANILNNKEMIKILNNTDLRILSKYSRIFVILLKSRKKIIVLLFFKVRSFLKK